MTQITVEEINRLRKETGAGLMDCKKALQEASGDFEKAKEILRKKGIELMKLKAGRTAQEGTVALRVSEDATRGVIVALMCETDFVAMNPEFVSFAERLAETALQENIDGVEKLMEATLKGTPYNVKEGLGELTGKIGEKIEVSVCKLLVGEYVYGYLHYNRKVGVLVSFDRRVDEQVAGDIAMQIAAMNPLAVSLEDVPQEVIEKEREIAMEQSKALNKPAEILEKIVEGKVKKVLSERVLLTQLFFKEQKRTVGDYLNEKAPGAVVREFMRVAIND